MSFVIDENNELIKYDDGFKYSENFILPDNVRSIGFSAFKDDTRLKTFKAGNSLKCIYDHAFSGCKNLEKLEIPEGTDIDSTALIGCEKLADKNGFIIINNRLFGYYGHEKRVVIPEGIESIEFFRDPYIEDDRYLSIEEVLLPKTLKQIKAEAFSGCKNLRSLEIPENVEIEGSAFTDCESLADENGFVIINNCVFGYYGKDKCVVVPEGVEIIKCFYIPGRDKLYSNIEELYLPESLKSIENTVFEAENLKYVYYKGKDSLAEEGSLFEYNSFCNKYAYIYINGRKMTCDEILDLEAITQKELEFDETEHAKRKPDELFMYHQFVSDLGLLCILDKQEYVYPDQYRCHQDIRHVILGNIRISNEVFRECHNLERVEFISEPGSFGDGAFKDCEKLQDDNGFVIVADILFDYFGNEEHVVVPENVNRVDVYAFMYNEKIKTVQLPEGIEELMECSFQYCPNLEEVKIGNEIYNFREYLDEPQGNMRIRDGELRWVDIKEHLSTIVIPEGIKSIKPGVFSNISVENLIIPEGVKELKPYVFKDVENLYKVHLPDSLEIIGEGAFEGCDLLEKINIPKNLKTVQKNAFKWTNFSFKKLFEKGVMTEDELEPDVRDCYTSFTLYQEPTIYYDEFHNPIDPSVIEAARHKYDGLTEYSVPEGIKYLLDAEFYNKSFVEVSLPEGLEEIKEFAFMCCKDLKRIVIPSTVKRIDRCAFMGCDSLEEVIVPETTIIETSAFAHCPKLQDENGFVVVNRILFSSPSSLEGLSLPEGIIKIDENVTNRAVLELKDNPLVKKYRKAMGRYFI